MFESVHEFKFIESNKGEKKRDDGSVSQYHFVKLANPNTFENLPMSADYNLDFDSIDRGQNVNVILELQERFGKTQPVIKKLEVM